MASLTLLALLGLALLAGCSSGAAGRPMAPGAATVVRVIDGDTVVVDLGGQDVTVRLLGIDTPETHHPTRPVECHGPEAAARLAELVPPGTAVALTRDVELHDVHGRLLAYVARADDGLDLSTTMAAEGHADALRIAPNVAHAAEVSAAVAEARAARRGLWGRCAGPHSEAGAVPLPP